MVTNAAGMIAKYLATSLAMLKVVSEPRVISICLPVSTTSISLVGLLSRSTMLPASLAACVPVFIATATSACASAGASLVPSPVIATSRPFGLLLADQRELVLRRGLGEEVVDAGLGRDRRGGELVVAGDHHGLDAHAAQLGEALLDAALDDVLQLDRRPVTLVPSDTTSGVLPRRATRRWPAPCTAGRHAAARAPAHARAIALAPRPCGACTHQRPGRRRSCEFAPRSARSARPALHVALAQVELLLGQHDDAAALGRLVGQRGQLRRVGQLGSP